MFLSLVDDSILFKCRYARTVSATSEMTIATSAESAEAIGSGDLTYSMNIDAGVVGGNSVISISPNHNISGIGAR